VSGDTFGLPNLTIRPDSDSDEDEIDELLRPRSTRSRVSSRVSANDIFGSPSLSMRPDTDSNEEVSEEEFDESEEDTEEEEEELERGNTGLVHHQLAGLHIKGFFTRGDPQPLSALFHLFRAAKDGRSEALRALAKLYWGDVTGLGFTQLESSQVRAFVREARLALGKNLITSLQLWRRAADAGDPASLLHLAEFFQVGPMEDDSEEETTSEEEDSDDEGDEGDERKSRPSKPARTPIPNVPLPTLPLQWGAPNWRKSLDFYSKAISRYKEQGKRAPLARLYRSQANLLKQGAVVFSSCLFRPSPQHLRSRGAAVHISELTCCCLY
jgi:hypothetical protein